MYGLVLGAYAVSNISQRGREHNKKKGPPLVGSTQRGKERGGREVEFTDSLVYLIPGILYEESRCQFISSHDVLYIPQLMEYYVPFSLVPLSFVKSFIPFYATTRISPRPTLSKPSGLIAFRSRAFVCWKAYSEGGRTRSDSAGFPFFSSSSFFSFSSYDITVIIGTVQDVIAIWAHVLYNTCGSSFDPPACILIEWGNPVRGSP